MSEEAKWYVVHTYSGYENKVAKDIEKVVENRKLQDLIPEVRVPTELVTEVKENKRSGKQETKEVEKKLFPSYVLVKMVLTDDSWYIVRNTRGVTGFVSTNPNKPLPIADSDLVAMGIDTDWVPEVDYDVGSTIRVISGPFADSICVVEEMNNEKQQVKVKLTMFGRETPVYLDFTQVEKI